MRQFSTPDKIIFFRNLAAMVSAGVSVLYALEALRAQKLPRKVELALEGITTDIKNGQRVSTAFARHPKLFSSFIYETIKVGESVGGLAGTLERIALNLEYNYALRRKVVGALTYPVVVVVVLVVMVAAMVWFVLPKLDQLYRDLHAPLPVVTRALLLVGHFVQEQVLWLGLGMVVLAVLAKFALRVPRLRHLMHRLALRVPVFGSLIGDWCIAQFFRHLETLIGSGVPLVHAVSIAQRTITNKVYRTVLGAVGQALLTGVPLSRALKQYERLFSSQLLVIIEVGERAGKLALSASYITTHYEQTINHKTQMLSSLLEPVLMVVIGVVIGVFALAIFLPIYQISNIMQ